MRSHSELLRIRTPTYLSWGHNSAHNMDKVQRWEEWKVEIVTTRAFGIDRNGTDTESERTEAVERDRMRDGL